MILVYPIKSSSAGNMFVVGDNFTNVIIDCGLSLKEFQHGISLYKNKVDPFKISGMLITHEHKDHCVGIESIAKHYNIPVFLTQGTFNVISKTKNVDYNIIKAFNHFNIGTLKIAALDIKHSNTNNTFCKEPVNFVIVNELRQKLVYLTDTGKIDYDIKNADAYLIEANHSNDYYTTNKATGHIKRKQERAMSDFGHLSIEYAIEYIKMVKGPNTKNVELIHLSSIGSQPDFFLKQAQKELPDLKIRVLLPDKFQDKELLINLN